MNKPAIYTIRYGKSSNLHLVQVHHDLHLQVLILSPTEQTALRNDLQNQRYRRNQVLDATAEPSEQIFFTFAPGIIALRDAYGEITLTGSNDREMLLDLLSPRPVRASR